MIKVAMMFSTCPRFLTATFIAMAAAAPVIGFAADRPSSDCLPDSAFALARLAAPARFGEAFKRTAFGRLLTDEKRIESLMALLGEFAGEEADEAKQQLSELGLDSSDFSRLWTGEAGAAFVMPPDATNETPPVMLVWFEPDHDLAERVPGIIERMLENPDSEVTRVDEKIGDVAISHFTIPPSAVSVEDEEDIELDAEDDEALPGREKTHARTENLHVLQHRRGDRYLLSIVSGDKGLDIGELVFSGFIAAHESDANEFGEKLLASGGIADTAPRGIPGFELYAYLAPLWSALERSDEMKDNAFLKASHLKEVTALAMTMSIDGNLLRTNSFLAAPSPRKGLLQMLELPNVSNEPPNWVPDTVAQYAHFGIDIPALYRQIRELTVAVGGPDVEQNFDMMEQQSTAFLGVSLQALLDGLGKRLIIVTYPTLNGPSAPLENTDRLALVWELNDEESWQKVFTALGNFIPPNALAPANEQGFTGFRFNPMGQPGVPNGGIFLGRSQFIFSFGEGVTEEILAALRTPVAAEASLAASAKVRRAKTLLPQRQSFAWSVTELGDQIDKIAKQFRKYYDLLSAINSETRIGNAVDKAVALMPSLEEVRETVGLSVNQMWTSADGIGMESAAELPLAEE
jgi:hypothetical protein